MAVVTVCGSQIGVAIIVQVSAPNPLKASKKLLGKLGLRSHTEHRAGTAASVGHQESEGVCL